MFMKSIRTYIILSLLVSLSLSSISVKAKSPIKQLIERAEGGNADEQFRLANCYSYGYGVKRDSAKARFWKNMAQKNGCVLASSDYCDSLVNRTDIASKIVWNDCRPGWKSSYVEKDSIYNLYSQLVREDDHSALFDYAFYLTASKLSSYSIQDRPIIDSLLKRADSYCIPCLYGCAGRFYEDDFDNDERFFDEDGNLNKAGMARIDSIRNFYVMAKENIRLYYFYKSLASKVDDKERYFLSKAAKQQKAIIKINPPYGYLFAAVEELEQYNYNKGIDLLRKSERSGNLAASGHLGVLTLFGLGTEANPKLAVEKMKKAADNLYMVNDYLGYCYMNGIGTPKNDSLAYLCWSKNDYNNPFSAGTYCPFLNKKSRNSTLKPGMKIDLPILKCKNADIEAIAKTMDWDSLHHFVDIIVMETDGQRCVRFCNEHVKRDSIQDIDLDRVIPCVGKFDTKGTTYLVYGNLADDYFEQVGHEELILAKGILWFDGVDLQCGVINNNRVYIFDKYYGSGVSVGKVGIDAIDIDYSRFNFDAKKLKRE